MLSADFQVKLAKLIKEEVDVSVNEYLLSEQMIKCLLATLNYTSDLMKDITG